jgi:hypothetical protein
MSATVKSKLLRLVEQEIVIADNRYDFVEVDELIDIVENYLGFKTKANKLREQYL